MNSSPTELRAANVQYFLRAIVGSQAAAQQQPNQKTAQSAAKSVRVVAFMLGALALTAGSVAAQQPYVPQQYGYGSPYAGQYNQPVQQAPYAQPQYAQPAQRYGYSQPQYSTQPAYPSQAQPYPAQQQPYADQSQYANQPNTNQGYPSEDDLAAPAPAAVQALAADQLEQMLAPIALYPDALLAQILAASTYPAQVAGADQWLQQMRAQGSGSADQVAAGANAQTTWDPSIKALTAFPDVLDMLDHNLQWTTALGNAYYNQPQDVMQTVQVLRQRAEQAGNLQSTPQEDVTSNQGYVDIAPPDPQNVYVPTYNPWDVYGEQISPYPGFSLAGSLGDFFGSSPIQYALSFALGAFDRTPFGLLSWGLDWLANGILFDRGTWNSRSTELVDWGLPHGGPRAFPGWHSPARSPGYFNRGYGGAYARNERGDQRGGWSNGAGRPGNFERPAAGVPYNHGNEMNRGGDAFNRGNQAYNRAPDQFNHGQENFSRGAENYNHGNQSYSNGYARAGNPGNAHPALPGQLAYNRAATQPGYAYRTQQAYSNPGYGYHPQTYPNRPQSYAGRPATPNFSSPANGYGYTNRATQGNGQTNGQQAYGSRPSYGYNSPGSSYRAPQFDSRSYSSRSYSSHGNNFVRNESGGFRGFGGEKAPRDSAPKYSYKASKSFGHESFGHQSFGHQSAPRAPKMGHSIGGGGGHKHR